ncbi:hypothetical protein AB0K16_22485 [Nonomuraea jabiensis]|uniref:hypothetical protein n=1 Tax=Nonomuraea jabiensis TaxID=882448 RepID=UPI00342416D4
MAIYPGGIRTWTNKRDFSQDIIESHMNDLQSELVAGEKIWGVNPQIATANPGDLIRDYGTVGSRLTYMTRGEHWPYYQGAVIDYTLHSSSQATNPVVPSQDPDGRDLEWCGQARRQRAKVLRLLSGEQVWLPYHWEVPNPAGEDEPWLGLPLEQDAESTADGGWQRLPFSPLNADDPFSMHIGDGIRLNETGLWMVNLKVDHLPTEDTVDVRARRRARLEINGRDATLRHLVRENEYNGSFLSNVVTWIEVLPKGTIITASARLDGTDLTDSTECNAYLRAHLIRCTADEDDGMLHDFPKSIYTPPPPPPPRAPDVPPTPRGNEYTPNYGGISIGGGLGGPYAIEARPGEWYGFYGWGTVGPQSNSYFVGIGSVGGVNI